MSQIQCIVESRPAVLGICATFVLHPPREPLTFISTSMVPWLNGYGVELATEKVARSNSAVPTAVSISGNNLGQGVHKRVLYCQAWCICR